MPIATVEISSTDKSEKALPRQKPTKNAFLNTNDSTFTELVQCHIYEFAPMTFRINSTDMPAILQTRIWWHPHHAFFLLLLFRGCIPFQFTNFLARCAFDCNSFSILGSLNLFSCTGCGNSLHHYLQFSQTTFLFLNCFTVDTFCNKCGLVIFHSIFTFNNLNAHSWKISPYLKKNNKK